MKCNDGRRALDLLVSCSGLIVLYPVFLVVSLAIILDSGLPVLFKQQRVARRGKLFMLYKFRTMRNSNKQVWVDVGGARPQRSELHNLRRSFVTTSPMDIRVTRVGAVLRRYHLDELPQLWNVLEGSMSLVGPRPDTPIQEIDYNEHVWLERCSVDPGLTGPAQVMGGKGLTPWRRVSLELAYIRCRRGLRLDVMILIKTIGALFRGGSY
jgi:lipopolysaccharide/colanic/teichoic acid biosynthesis glycosyltransferase